MLYDFLRNEQYADKPLYLQIYFSVRDAIENGNLKKGDKLPSIRGLCEQLKISKTTVISAYDQLKAEGYILNRPQSGYYVAAQFDSLPPSSRQTVAGSADERPYFEYDFSTNSTDDTILNLAAWRKEIKDVINRSYLLTSYGDVQGEEALRRSLRQYALGIRSVSTDEDRIVVGAGTQAILFILCSMLGHKKTVAMQRASFVQSEFVFRSFDYTVTFFDSDDFGVTIDSLDRLQPDVILINPNYSGTSGCNMPVSRRLEIIAWARAHDALILEDDFNGELRYSTLPVPCVQHYDSERTVYVGSFSKVLLPSVRISYMVLPERLLAQYEAVKQMINQTASKAEQLALASYIRSGRIDGHIRRARRIYLEKSRLTHESLARLLPEAQLRFNETAMYFRAVVPYDVDRERIDKALSQNYIRLMRYRENARDFGISFSGIPTEKIAPGIALLSEIIRQNKTADH